MKLSTKTLRAMCWQEASTAGFNAAQHHNGAVPNPMPEFVRDQAQQNWWGSHGFASLYERGFWHGFEAYCQH